MKPARSMPSLVAIDTSASRHPLLAKRPMIRSRSMASHPETAVKTMVRSVPFMAVAGIGSHLRSMQRSLSKSHIASLSSSAITSPTHPRPKPASLPVSDEMSALLPHYLTPPKYTTALSLAVLSSVLSSFQNGLNSSLLNVPESTIRRALQLSEIEWSLIVSVFCIGGLIGSLIGGRLADRLGRKNLIISTNVLFILGGLLAALAQNCLMLIVARIVIGCGCGISSVLVPLYLGEISPAELRGSLGTMNQFSIVIGILLANVMGKWGTGTGHGSEWRYLLGSILVPSLLQLCLSATLLESPLWLVCHSGAGDSHYQSKSHSAAEEILLRLRGTVNAHDIEFELEGFEAEKEKNLHHTSVSLSSALANTTVRKALVVGLGLQFAQQFSGINAVFYYSTAFFAKAHVSDPWLGSVLAAAINVLATTVAIPLMDRKGRRVLLLISAIGMSVSCLGLTGALYYQQLSDSPVLSILSVVGVLLYVTFFELGLGPIAWLLSAEIYPSAFRALGMSLAAIVNWSANFFISLTFPHVNNSLREFTFLPFSVILLLSAVFIYLRVPETRGRSLDQIQQLLEGHIFIEGDDTDAVLDGYDSDASFGSVGSHGNFTGYSIHMSGVQYGSVDDEANPLSGQSSPGSSLSNSSSFSQHQTPRNMQHARF